MTRAEKRLGEGFRHTKLCGPAVKQREHGESYTNHGRLDREINARRLDPILFDPRSTFMSVAIGLADVFFRESN
jgi:hypothetical protein